MKNSMIYMALILFFSKADNISFTYNYNLPIQKISMDSIVVKYDNDTNCREYSLVSHQDENLSILGLGSGFSDSLKIKFGENEETGFYESNLFTNDVVDFQMISLIRSPIKAELEFISSPKRYFSIDINKEYDYIYISNMKSYWEVTYRQCPIVSF